MKQRIALSAAGLLLVTGILSNGSITGSKHDFSNKTTYPWANGEICLPCHAPHNNVNTTGLLWNHAASSATYTFYSSPTMKAATPLVMTDISKTCMGCHDGTVALDAFGGSAGNAANKLTGTNNLGQVLSNDHPISITYDATKARMHPTSAASGLPGGTTILADLLYSGKVECNSCHDVHNSYSVPGRGMLKKSNASSALCMTCHNM